MCGIASPSLDCAVSVGLVTVVQGRKAAMPVLLQRAIFTRQQHGCLL